MCQGKKGNDTSPLTKQLQERALVIEQTMSHVVLGHPPSWLPRYASLTSCRRTNMASTPHILFFQLPSLLRALARLLPHFQAANDGCFIQATFQFQSASGCPFPLVIKKSGENWRLCTPKSLQPTIPATSDPERPHKFGGTRQRESDVSMGPQRARRSCPHVHAARPVRSRSCPYALCSVLSAGGGPQQSSCVLSRTAYWSSQVLLRCTPY